MRDDLWKGQADTAMERYATGEDVAFAELYGLVAPPLRAYLRRRTRDTARAEELLQDTFLRMHAHRHHFVRGDGVMRWAYGIARRLLIDDHRRVRPAATDHGDAGCGAPRVDEVVAVHRLARRIDEELRRVPHHHREAFTLVRIEGLSMKEAAAVLGCTATAVKLRAYRTYEALRERLGETVCEELGAGT